VKRPTLVIILLFLVAYALASVFAAAATVWAPEGTLGLTTDYGGHIRAVTPGGPAGRAGIVVGDQVDLAAMPFSERGYVVGILTVIRPGVRVDLHVVRAGVSRDVPLVAVLGVHTDADLTSIVLQCVTSLVFIIVGAGLIILRPSLATWGFGLYCLLDLPTSYYPFRLGTGADALLLRSIFDVVQNFGVVGLPLFALEFPSRIGTPLHRVVRRLLPITFVVLAAMTLYPDIATLALGRGAELENYALQLVFGLVFIVTIATLYDTFRRIEAIEKERMRWVLIGFGVGLMISYIGSTLLFSSLIAVAVPLWLSSLLVCLNVLLPIAIAHAVIRHRVLDITFVVSQTIVYAALTTILAGLFELLDYLFGSFLEEFRLARIFEAGVAICVAFAFETVRTRVERVVEFVLFKKRRLVEQHLMRLTDGLPKAQSVEEIGSVLVHEVGKTLGFTSAAFFVLTDEAFVRKTAYGYDDAATSLANADVLVLALRAQPHAIRLAELASWDTGFPGPGRAAVLALPLQSRDVLSGLVLYGGHTNGADFDADEKRALEALAHAASDGLEKIEALALRVAYERMHAELLEAEARLDEVRRAAEAENV
jgi:hypothetical protein